RNDPQLFADVVVVGLMPFHTFDARLSPRVDAGSHRGRCAAAGGKIDKIARGLSAQHCVRGMAGVGVDFRSKRSQHIRRVLRIVYGIANLGISEPELSADFWKFPGEIVVPIDSIDTICWKIRFAHTRTVLPR